MHKLNKMPDNQDILNLDIFNQLPSFYGVVDLNSRLLVANKAGLDWIGYPSNDSAAGISYNDLRCKVAEESPFLMQQDALTKANSRIQCIGYYCYAHDDWKVVFGEKTLIQLPHGAGQGILCHFTNVTGSHVLDIARFMLDLDKKHHFLSVKKQCGYILTETYYDEHLTERESECLFFLMRGLTAKSIAEIFKTSVRTIEVHIANIKMKMACKNKAEVVEKAIAKGLLNIIPKSLL